MTQLARKLVWLGTNSTTWDTTTLNWFNTSAGSVDKFFDLDNVSFTDLGAAHGNISIASTFAVGALNVSLTLAASSYNFSGTGYLTGVTGLVMTGSGSVPQHAQSTDRRDRHARRQPTLKPAAHWRRSGTNVTYLGGPASAIRRRLPSTAAARSGHVDCARLCAGSTGADENGGVVNVVTRQPRRRRLALALYTKGRRNQYSQLAPPGRRSSGTGVANIRAEP